MTRTATDYAAFLADKQIVAGPVGIENPPALNAALFPFQRDITEWALRRGRAAIFADCGLGKTLMQLEWARCVAATTQRPVLILAPLAVAEQTEAEAARFGIEARYVRQDGDDGILVSNYEMLEHFDVERFAGVVIDESSILKAYDGATRNAIINAAQQVPYRLACTATPAPNDFMELGNHSEFLGVLTRPEMLATFFVHDGGETQTWRLKKHARQAFWKWLASWSVMLRKPSDLGYDDTGYELPALSVEQHIVTSPPDDGSLFALEALGLQERITARRDSVAERARAAAALVNASTEPWVVWCHLNSEADSFRALCPDAVEVRGSDDWDKKRATLTRFAAGGIRVLITKPSIAGFGMNWQHCARMAFLGVSDSWEQYYQATRRCWRFGQKRPVTVHVIASEREGSVVSNLQRKDQQADELARELIAHMSTLNRQALHHTMRTGDQYSEETVAGRNGQWTMHRGDCVEVMRRLPDDSAHFSVHSPPFASLYTYSASERDMGNCRSHDEFFAHYQFAIAELYRLTMAGRLAAVHCMNLPTSKARDGVIGITDFRGEIIRAYEAAGWIYHSEVTIWKDPVTAMQRTKALGLLYKQLRKDSAMSRQGIADYLVVFRKPGENPEPVTKTHEGFPVGLWQRFASPVWMDINPSDTLQFRSAREQEDERHIAPLQLEVIRRATLLWSNPGDVVLSPFAGIGSEGFVAIEEGRRFVGVELKRSYFEQACRNLENAHARSESDLFSAAEVGA
jgi:DNA modification methylase/superfamily II DNA or RNA helicase